MVIVETDTEGHLFTRGYNWIQMYDCRSGSLLNTVRIKQQFVSIHYIFEYDAILAGIKAGNLNFYKKGGDGLTEIATKDKKDTFHLSTGFQNETRELTHFASSSWAEAIPSEKFIAAAGGEENSIIIIWRQSDIELDLPSAQVDTKGKVVDMKIVQDKDRAINILVSLHEKPACLNIISLRDYKIIK